MRHYEIVILVHPDQTPQVEGMVSRYKSLIEKGGGVVHRAEDWGRRQLAFTIDKVKKAHYYMLNIECNQAVLDELNTGFRYNDAIIRHLVLARSKAYTDPSPMAAEAEKKSRYKQESGRYDRSRSADRSAENKKESTTEAVAQSAASESES